MKEIWKPVKGFEESHEVSSMGRVRSLDRVDSIGRHIKGKTLSNVHHNHGYETLGLTLFGKTKRYLVHRLVAEAFIENPENKPQVNHKNGIKTDNRVENLEWVTRSENMQHSYDHLGRISPMKDNHRPSLWTRKLTNTQVESIKHDSRSASELANEYGVSRATIYNVRKGKYYNT